jgi:hypothetical protein
VIYVGAALFAFGLYFYFGKGAAALVQRMVDNAGGMFWPQTMFGMAPFGMSMMLMGAAFAIGKNWFTDDLLMAALAFVALAFVHVVIHPKWSRPKWWK